MRYQVPQFIEFESKVIGPFSIRQFSYMLGGLGGTYLIYRFLGFFPGVILFTPLLALSFCLAFVTWNGRKFIDVLASAFSYVLGNKLYIWKKIDKPVTTEDADKTSVADAFVSPSLSQSKLKDLAWSLDVKENVLSTNKNEYQKDLTE
ncbi:MAG: hypothetical protein V4576_03505 [Patescibacteria group bacterium]